MEGRIGVTWLWHGRWQGDVCEHMCIKHVGSGSNTRSPRQLGPLAQPPGPALNGPRVPTLQANSR